MLFYNDSVQALIIEFDRLDITFDTDGGTAIASVTQDYGTDVTAPADPTKEGYTFAGWDTEIPSIMPAENMTITAKWTINKYTVKFVDEDGTELQSGEVAYGETPVYTGKTPVKTGNAQYSYIFAGWEPVVAAVTGEATYKATFANSTNTYTVTWVDENGTSVDYESVVYGGNTSKTPAVPEKVGQTGSSIGNESILLIISL